MCVYRDQGDEDDYYDDRAPQTVNTLGEHWNILGLLVVNYRYLYYWYLNNIIIWSSNVDRTETSSRLTLGRSAMSIYIIYDKCPCILPTICPEILFTAIVRSEPTWKNVGRPAAGKKKTLEVEPLQYIVMRITYY